MMAAILGLKPALDPRLIIAIRSGTAANLVPRPARKPMISERCRYFARRLAVSCGIRFSRTHRATRPLRKEPQALLFSVAQSYTSADEYSRSSSRCCCPMAAHS